MLKRTLTVDLTESTYHRLLASDRRRIVVDVLEEREPPITVEELATEIAERESGGGTDADLRTRIRTELHHVDLPKLSDAGLLEYDCETNCVESHEVDRDLLTS